MSLALKTGMDSGRCWQSLLLFFSDSLQVLVVNEEWGSGTHSSLRNPEKSGSGSVKKVSLGDDTDAKSAGDEPRLLSLLPGKLD